jgi:NAD(P)-dependent dehydrogenase (short-subunit alcohol dehydrogenase family)
MTFDWVGKNTLVTGGARGLGLELARVLVAKGSSVAIVARDQAEIARALDDLARRPGRASARVRGYDCDLTDPAAVDRMLEQVQGDFGGLDVLVNNAGIIQVGPLDAMTIADFEQAMQVHCFAPLRTMLGVRASMRARGGGRIANVASIGGIVAVPHLLPYSASKFALMGLSQGMRAELARDRIYVSTIAPGLMRTGSPRGALFKGQHRKEYAWFAISDSLPLLSVDATRAARRIVRAIERGEPHVVIGAPARLAMWASALAPNLVARLMTVANRLLPAGADPRAWRGFESESTAVPSPVTVLSERAATRNNERGAG